MTGQFISRDPLTSMTGSPYAYVYGDPLNMVDPLGLCGWRDPWNCVDDAARFVKENPGTVATAIGIGVCVLGSIGVCGAAAVGAFAVRAGERIDEQGVRTSLGTNLLDTGLTYAAFGLVAAPAWYGLQQGGKVAVTGVLAAGQQGIMTGSRLAQQALARFLAATPDLAGWLGGILSGGSKAQGPC